VLTQAAQFRPPPCLEVPQYPRHVQPACGDLADRDSGHDKDTTATKVVRDQAGSAAHRMLDPVRLPR